MNTPELSIIQRQAFLQVADMRPLLAVSQGTELMQHLGVEDFYVNTRDAFLAALPTKRTMMTVIWARTGSAKRFLASEWLYLAKYDPKMQEELVDRGIDKLRLGYYGFSPAANNAIERGLIDPTHGHGNFSTTEYADISKIHWRHTAGAFHVYSNEAVWGVVEATGPTAEITPDGILQGDDRAFSSVDMLTTYFKEQTRVLVLVRGGAVYKKIIKFRKALPDVPLEQLPKFLSKSGTIFYRGDQPLDLSTLSLPELESLKGELLETHASAKGVKRINGEMDRLIERSGASNEVGFWHRRLRGDFRLTDGYYMVVENPYSDKPFALHHELLNESDPIKRETEWIKSLKRGVNP